MPETQSVPVRDQLFRFADAMAETVRAPLVVVDPHLRIMAASAAFSDLAQAGDMSARPGGDLREQELLALNAGRWDLPAFRQALEQVLPQGRGFEDLEVPGDAGASLLVSGRGLFGDDAGGGIIILNFTMIQAEQRIEPRLREAASVAEGLLATVREPALVLDAGHRVVMASASFSRLLGTTRQAVEGQLLGDLDGRAFDLPELHSGLDAILSEDGRLDGLELEQRLDGIGVRRLRLSARRIEGAERILLTAEDVSERHRPGDRLDMLVSELAHRVKNLLALVQSLAMQTRGASVEEYRRAFLSRLKALALAHGALLETQWESARLRGLLNELLVPFMQDGAERVQLEGPAVRLSAQQVTIFALIIHELASNAARHGALSVPDGRVRLSWGAKEGRLRLEWRESGVRLSGHDSQSPQLAGGTGEPGFGTVLIERAASYQLQGQAEMRFEPEGLLCVLEFPLPIEAAS